MERYLLQAAVLPSCAAVVSHAGSGSVTGALMHGLPSVLLPMGADQPHNAARCEQLGVARVLDAVLTQVGYRLSAESIRKELAALPSVEHALDLLEQVNR